MNASRFRPDADYWDGKLSNYLHDPPDKALAIVGHEARSRLLAEVVGPLPTPDPVEYGRADAIAAGMDRAQLPPYRPDPGQSGAINFLEHPVLTHPTGAPGTLRVVLPEGWEQRDISQAVVQLVEADLAKLAEAPEFEGNPAAFAAARFHYVHHLLRERLACEKVGGLGGLWHRLPADTRQPDHSIWQHCALVAALTSCFALSPQRKASLLVFSLTPVQDFIGRARKLRDFWSASLILSWLAFEGLRTIIYGLGSDHVLYPSLVGQPLMHWLLARECHLARLKGVEATAGMAKGVASFPNKFVCLVPAGQEQDLAGKIQQGIQDAWETMGHDTLALLEQKLGVQDAYLKNQIVRQMGHYWDYHWAACPLVAEGAESTIPQLLPASVWRRPFSIKKKIIQQSWPFQGEGAFYPITHALIQSHLAAGKSRRTDRRPPEEGIKCGLHGDLEILRLSWKEEKDKNPRPAQDPFWAELKKRWQPLSDFKGPERLSAVAVVKRLAYRVCQRTPDHPLGPLFKEADTFPSTTEMALADWFQEVEQSGVLQDFPELRPERWRRVVAQVLHEQEGDTLRPEREPEIEVLKPEERLSVKALLQRLKQKVPVRDEDKYYAILLMDGDHMGKLVNGETVASRWDTVLHPEVVHRLRRPDFPQPYRDFWAQELPRPRTLAPAVHAAISEALGDFSLHTVPAIIRRHRGRLIYAGGDDVCAILPVSEALGAAREIAAWYNQAFVFLPETPGTDALPQPLADTWTCTAGRLAVHLGQGPDISISGGLLIVHHKRPLAGALRRAHELLHLAKEQGGRNALAFELEKRAGGSRLMVGRWQEKPWPALGLPFPDGEGTLWVLLEKLAAALGRPPFRELSASLIYRLEELQPALAAMADQAPAELVALVQAQVQRSNPDAEEVRRLACLITALLIRSPGGDGRMQIDPAPLLIAKFLGSRQSRRQSKEVANA